MKVQNMINTKNMIKKEIGVIVEKEARKKIRIVKNIKALKEIVLLEIEAKRKIKVDLLEGKVLKKLIILTRKNLIIETSIDKIGDQMIEISNQEDPLKKEKLLILKEDQDLDH